jgi:electron transfer flavoprotein beta subunit
MRLLVCLTHVPAVADSGVEIARDGRSIVTADLTRDPGEWELAALEAAVQLREGAGAHVTALTVGDEDSEPALRKALAMGADGAVRIDRPAPADPLVAARCIAAVARDRELDLVLCGVQAADHGYGVVAPALGALLGWPHATMVVELAPAPAGWAAVRELEEGRRERLALTRPAVIGVQTGLAEPRYVSVMGIRRTRKLPIEVVEPAPAEEGLELLELTAPLATRQVDLLEGTPAAMATRVVELVRREVGS